MQDAFLRTLPGTMQCDGFFAALLIGTRAASDLALRMTARIDTDASRGAE
jgi:hypothetical protein